MKTAQELAEAMGFRFLLDWDDQLTIQHPEEIDVEAMAQWIAANEAKSIVSRFKCAARQASSVLVGGPFAGRKTSRRWGEICVWQRARADWSVYCVAQDGKGYYAGQATSRPKAMELGRLRAMELARVEYLSPHSYRLHSSS